MNADKKQIWINGQFVEVTDEVYTAYMQGDRKIRYFETDLKVERAVFKEDGTINKIIPSREDSLDRLMDDNAAQYADESESVENVVFRQMENEKLHTALSKLFQEERSLIKALFFEEQTEREYAERLGISQPAVHKRKNKTLAKLKYFLEN
ncbi:MAG TPA: sigma-70 family RNA polymerase sigma factor [Clostridiales bacterium]|nr:sigma-70 family RNA polymerase sigma factor [Clostridiales bacterium]